MLDNDIIMDRNVKGVFKMVQSACVICPSENWGDFWEQIDVWYSAHDMYFMYEVEKHALIQEPSWYFCLK